MPNIKYDKKAGTKTVLDEKGKTVYYNYGSKNQYKVVFNKQGKTITSSDGTKNVYNKKGNTTTFRSGEKQIRDKQGYTAYRPDNTVATENKKGRAETTKFDDAYGGTTVKYTDTKGNTQVKYTKAGDETYKKYDAAGNLVGGYQQNKQGSFGSTDGGKKIPIPVTKKEETVNPPVKTGSGKTVSQLWKEKTGTSWSEAKKQGLTDGSMKANLALMAKLKSGEYKPKTKPKTKVETKVEVKPEFKVSSNIKPNEIGPYYSKSEEEANRGKMGPMDDPNKPKLKKGGSIKSKITAVKSKIKAKIKSKIMAIKKPLLKAKVGMSTPQDKKSSSGQATQYNKAITPGGSKGDVAKSSVGNFKRGGSIKMKTVGTMKMKTGGMVNSNKKVLVKAMYGRAMKPTMMRSGSTTKKYLTGGTTGTPKYDDQPKKATTLKKAMYGTMMKPKIMIKGRVTKKK
jgi:hypothetical protein